MSTVERYFIEESTSGRRLQVVDRTNGEIINTYYFYLDAKGSADYYNFISKKPVNFAYC